MSKYIYIYMYMVTPHDAYEALLLYYQHNLLHAAMLSEEPKTLLFTVFSALRTVR